jgi:hypothetical protein
MDAPAEARRGQGIWALLVGAVLLGMELVVLAALVPVSWSERVRETEAAWLRAGLGEATAGAVRASARSWFERLFVEPGLVDGTYALLLPGPRDLARSPELAPIAASPGWAWVEGRLDVVWGAVYLALQRLAVIAAWRPLLLPLGLAAWGEGWVRRRIRQASFAYPSPLAHRYALRAMAGIGLLVGLGLLLPVPLPVLTVPVLGAVLAGLLCLAVANAQKRL